MFFFLSLFLNDYINIFDLILIFLNIYVLLKNFILLVNIKVLVSMTNFDDFLFLIIVVVRFAVLEVFLEVYIVFILNFFMCLLIKLYKEKYLIMLF